MTPHPPSALELESDDLLVERSRAGNCEAFGALVVRYQSPICALAYSATGSLPQSEDLAQETFLSAWKDLSKLRDPSRFRGWLHGIARNVINNSLRRQAREPSHRAESLDNLPESAQSGPAPADQAISQEEAQILWRTLEHIPETYREPLILFYREHQSIEAVAATLELTEEAARQRLSRGRKLLQEEVLAFVEGALSRTSPGKTFTIGVLAALPMAATSAKAATAGLAATKSATLAKALLSLGTMGSLLPMLPMIIWPWKTAVDESKSQQERRFMVRTAWIQIVLAVLALIAANLWMPSVATQPRGFAVYFALYLLALFGGALLTSIYISRRLMLIRLEEGTLMDALGESPEDLRNMALWKTIKAQVPYVAVIPIVGVFLPWNQHWFRCLVVLGVMLLPGIWGAYFQYRQQIRPLEPRHSRLLNLIRNKPLLGIPIAMIVAGGVAASMCLLPWLYSYFLIVFLHPDWPAPKSSAEPFLRAARYVVALVILLSAPVALLVAFRERIFPKGSVLEKIIPWLGRMRLDPEKLMKETYAELLPLLRLDPDRERELKDLIWKSSTAAAAKTIPLMTPGLGASKRQALREALQNERAQFDEQTRLLLGEQGYEAFKQFGKTVPDRTFVQDFNKKLRRTGHEMSDEEARRFREALTKARANFAWTTELGRRDHDPANFLGQFSKQNAEVFAKEEEEFDRLFRLIALGLLTPPQFDEFQSFQTRRRRSQALQMKLAAKSLA